MGLAGPTLSVSSAAAWAGVSKDLHVLSTSIDPLERGCEISKTFKLEPLVTELSAVVWEQRIWGFEEKKGGESVSLSTLGVEEFTSSFETVLTCPGTVPSVGASSAECVCIA